VAAVSVSRSYAVAAPCCELLRATPPRQPRAPAVPAAARARAPAGDATHNASMPGAWYGASTARERLKYLW
jgi:hypothetical protein